MNSTSLKSATAPAVRDSTDPCVLDTRPMFTQGDPPCGAIDAAVAGLAPGQDLILLVPFEPIPLYAKLGRLGFAHDATQEADGSWRVQFRRNG